MAEAEKLIEQIVELAPSLKGQLVPYSEKEAFLKPRHLSLPKDEEARLREAGFEFTIGCWAACGYAYLKRVEHGSQVEYELVECFCHQGHYRIFVSKRGEGSGEAS